MIIPIKTQTGQYNIYLERGALKKVGEYFNLDRKVLVVTDDGVPPMYAKTVSDQCKDAVIITVSQGEKTKCIDSFVYAIMLYIP